MENKTELSLKSELKFEDIRGLISHIDPLFRFCVVVTFIWGFIAHGYCFANLTIGHDSLNEFVAADDWKISLGRFLEPWYYKLFRGSVVLPWMVGLMGLFWLALTVWVILRAFSVQDKVLIVFISGIITVNYTVTATAATFLNDFDAYMFAAFMAALGAYAWKRGGKNYILSVICSYIALGIYQSMFSVAIVLIMLLCMEDLLYGKDWLEVLKKGLVAILLLALAGGLYFLSVKLVWHFSGIKPTGDYNSLSALWAEKDQTLPERLMQTYAHWLKGIINPLSGDGEALRLLVSSLFLLLVLGVSLCFLFQKDIKPLSKLLYGFLLLLLPFASDISFFLDGGMSHTLMWFAFWFVYLLSMLLFRWLLLKKQSSLATLLLLIEVTILAITLLGNVRIANKAYVKRELERQAALSFMTKVTYSVEQTEGYVEGETKVCFVGTHFFGIDSQFYDVSNLVGMQYSTPMTFFSEEYLHTMLKSKIREATKEEKKAILNWMDEQKNDGEEIPRYPDKDSIFWKDDILVVKLGEF